MKKMNLRLMNLFLALAVSMIAGALEAQNNTATTVVTSERLPGTLRTTCFG